MFIYLYIVGDTWYFFEGFLREFTENTLRSLILGYLTKQK